MGKKLRILFFIESLHCGGAEKSLVSLLQTLDYSLYDVDLMLLRREGLFLEYVPEQVNIVPFPAPRSRVLHRLCSMVYSLKWRWLQRRGIRRHNAEVLWPLMRHAMASPQAQRPKHQSPKHKYDVAIAYQQGLPTYYIATMVNAPRRLAWINIDLRGAGYREEFNRPYYDKYDHTVAVSQQLYDALAQSGYVDSARLTTVYDILNPDVIRKLGAEQCNDMQHAPLRLVTVGRLSYQKNYPLAVETARVLRDRGVDFVWTFVGEGQERPEIERLIDLYGLAGKVVLAGVQANPYKYMAAADIYVHTASFEGYGLTIAEAKILRRPVVSTNFRIVYDQITDGVNGLIAEMTPESVADKIMTMATDNELRGRIIEAIGRETNLTAQTEIVKFNNLVNNDR